MTPTPKSKLTLDEILEDACVRGSHCTPSGCGTACIDDKDELKAAIIKAVLAVIPEHQENHLSSGGLWCGTPYGEGWNSCRNEILKRLEAL